MTDPTTNEDVETVPTIDTWLEHYAPATRAAELQAALVEAERRCRDMDGPMAACRLCEAISPTETAQAHKRSCPFAVLAYLTTQEPVL